MLKFILTTCMTIFLYPVYGVQKYDILTLTQQWPQTSCWVMNNKWPSGQDCRGTCNLPKAKNSWTLHGLWPSNKGRRMSPSNCDDKSPFNLKLINKALRNKMDQKWPSLNLKKKNEAFWKHEWKKHGTCALDIEETNSLPKYFSKSLQLLDEFNVGNRLEKFQITPNGEYGYSNITEAIDCRLGVNSYVKCAMNSGIQYLYEISICFDKMFRLTNCNTDHKTNCKKDEPILYPVCL